VHAVRWAPRAVTDLERIFNFLEQSNPAAALRAVETIYNAAGSLETFPERGRVSRRPGARELLCAPWPYIVVYRVAGETVEIARVWHAAQDWT
jgi:addiction module RelE/StbE family toxin